MKFSVPISSLSPRGLKNLIFSFYNKCRLLSKATNGNFFVSKDFCYSIGDGVFKEQLIDKIIGQQEEEQAKAQDAQEDVQGETALLGIKIENRTDDYDGDLVFTGFNQSESQEEQEAVQEKTAQVNAVQEDAVQEADKPNFDPAFENTPTVGTETAENTAANVDVNVAANNNAVDAVEVAFTLETPLLTIRDRAISAFLDYLVNHCNDVKHVALEDEETRIEAAKNEKFAMRAWFTQLGWRGKEDNELRSYFYDNLEGNTAFRTEEDHARWAARWQPKYFDKHPEMKWVLEEQREQEKRGEQSEPEVAEEQRKPGEQEATAESVEESAKSLIVPDETADADSTDLADSTEVAEAVSATVGTEESAEVDKEVLQESAREDTTETVADLANSADVVPEAEIEEAELDPETEFEPEMNPEITDEKQHSVSN